MKKPKKEEEEKTDNLEIISIGVLYQGPLDKKYWSCSRGKDRYPYPVGYQSIRAHNGSTYKMEIREGLKGPLFVITSADGQSCSGQTADIAWEMYQKQGFPRVKLLRGKRFSCKIDGVEFFGFRNSFVQRLLRELVANLDGTAKRSLPSSSFCNGASGTEHDRQSSDPCIYPDLQQYSARSSVTGKRSRKLKFINEKSVSGVNLKKSRSEDLTCNGGDLHVRQGNQRDNTDMDLKTFSETKEDNDICNHLGASLVSGNLETVAVGENISFPSPDIFPNKKLSEENSLDRSRGCVMHEFSISTASGESTEEAQPLKDASKINGKDLFAPDTLDDLHDDISDPAPTSSKEKPCYAEDELILCHVVGSDGPAPESHPEDEMAASIYNASCEKNYCDSVGEEIDKSMMTLLLPQALPLLKKATNKKKANINPPKSGHLMVVMPPARIPVEGSHVDREGKLHSTSGDPSPVVRSLEHRNSVIHDSLRNDHYGKNVNNRVHFELGEADQATNKSVCAPENLSLLGRDDTQKTSTVCHVSTSSSKEIYYPPHRPPDDRSQKGDLFISESALSCTSPRKKAFSDKSKDFSTNPHEISSCLETRSEEKTCGTSDYIEDTVNASLMGTETSLPLSYKELNFKREGCESGCIASTGMQNVDPLTRKYRCPLSESIIFRNFEDGCAPEGYPATGTLLALENCQVSSSNKSSNEQVSIGVEASLKRTHHDLHTEKSTLNVEGNIVPVKSCNQALDFVSGDKNTTESPDTPVLIEKCHSSIDKELVRHSNLAQFNNSEQRFQEQGKIFCNNSVIVSEEAQAGSDLKPHMIEEINSELGQFVELVGCYVHPMPISSVLSSITGNEIYICVLCGPLVDKDRTLFMYKLPIKEPRAGCPSFIGHAPITLPFSRDTFGTQMSLDRSGLQFTPDGQCLVLLNSIKAPYCREGKVHCTCSACTSDCFEENAIKIVKVNLGYVSLMAKLKTVNCVLSILVCRPDRLVAVEEGGGLHLWVMNSAWSAQTEEFVIPTSDSIYPCVEELKQIPKCAHLVIGHNGYGEFGLWDISKRILISRFSASSKSVIQFLPISLFGWKRKDPISSNPSVKEHMDKIMAAIKVSLSDHNENNAFLPSTEKELGIWLLVSTAPDSDAQYNYETKCQMNPVGWWRLALLMENVVILGSVLDQRVSAIGASAGHGIIATCDGLVYMWELSTGTKLGTLHNFKDGGISCIATDDSRSGVLAVAGDGGQLLVYLHRQRDSAD